MVEHVNMALARVLAVRVARVMLTVHRCASDNVGASQQDANERQPRSRRRVSSHAIDSAPARHPKRDGERRWGLPPCAFAVHELVQLAELLRCTGTGGGVPWGQPAPRKTGRMAGPTVVKENT